jgi:hypothetical protein
MEDFLRFFNGYCKKEFYELNVHYTSISDWIIEIGFKCTHPRHGEIIVHVQHCDMEYAFAKAQVNFKEWLLENEGGY